MTLKRFASSAELFLALYVQTMFVIFSVVGFGPGRLWDETAHLTTPTRTLVIIAAALLFIVQWGGVVTTTQMMQAAWKGGSPLDVALQLRSHAVPIKVLFGVLVIVAAIGMLASVLVINCVMKDAQRWPRAAMYAMEAALSLGAAIGAHVYVALSASLILPRPALDLLWKLRPIFDILITALALTLPCEIWRSWMPVY